VREGRGQHGSAEDAAEFLLHRVGQVDASAARAPHALPDEVVHASRCFTNPTEPQLHGVVQLFKKRGALKSATPRRAWGLLGQNRAISENTFFQISHVFKIH
jgi:hypothetical protein